MKSDNEIASELSKLGQIYQAIIRTGGRDSNLASSLNGLILALAWSLGIPTAKKPTDMIKEVVEEHMTKGS